MMPVAKLDEIRALIGKDLGVSTWLTVDQERIDKFADATDDHQFIHVDPEMAKQTPLGGTLAPGLLPLSLRSDDRRLGKDCFSTCRTRSYPYYTKNKIT